MCRRLREGCEDFSGDGGTERGGGDGDRNLLSRYSKETISSNPSLARVIRDCLADVRITPENGRIADVGGRLKSANERTRSRGSALRARAERVAAME
jgi:hypothetical protein